MGYADPFAQAEVFLSHIEEAEDRQSITDDYLRCSPPTKSSSVASAQG